MRLSSESQIKISELLVCVPFSLESLENLNISISCQHFSSTLLLHLQTERIIIICLHALSIEKKKNQAFPCIWGKGHKGGMYATLC